MSRVNHDGPSLASLISKDILRRAFFIALALGSVLVLTNQSDAILGHNDVQIPQLVLAYLTPFIVVTISQVLGIRRATLVARSARRQVHRRVTFLATALSHGIPLSAVLVGLSAGIANTSIVALATLMSTGTLSDLPTAVIAQAFALPMVFGLVSQTITYRRAIMTISRQLRSDVQTATT